MAKFLTTANTISEIERIINNANKHCFLISPYIKFPETLLQNLKDADRRKVKITLVYGKTELKPEERSRLEQLDNLSLYFLENLHAKCVFNEERMVITSMNLYDYSIGNREMGVLITKKDEQSVFSEAVREARIIVSSSTKRQAWKSTNNLQPERMAKASSIGCCIRCGETIPLDIKPPFRPFCRDCYLEWEEWGNPDYEEEYCHWCGNRAPTTINKPFCRSCYEEVAKRLM